MAECPCGSGLDDAACCQRFHDGLPAPTALALMRSRYTAYVRAAIARTGSAGPRGSPGGSAESLIDYLVETHDPATRRSVDRDAIARWSRDTEWLGLEILDTERGGPGDDTGIVEFVARGITRGAPFAQRERSRFRRVDGRWVYVDGTTTNAPVTRATTAGRNEPCPCGSGKKYKRCHGA